MKPKDLYSKKEKSIRNEILKFYIMQMFDFQTLFYS